MICVYLSSEPRNNFYLLHAVTSTWALAQLLPLLEAKESSSSNNNNSNNPSASDSSDSGSSSGGGGGGKTTVNINSQGFKMELLRVHLCTLLALYVSQRCPKLEQKYLVRALEFCINVLILKETKLKFIKF